MGWPVSASHSRIVLSALPETMRCPSGLKATLFTAPVWPVRGWPVFGSHSRRVCVGAAGNDAMPVGAERHTVHRALVAGQWGTEGLAGVGVPQPQRVIGAAGDDAPPVGANATLYTLSVCPVSGAPRGWPVSASHSRSVWSALPEASALPVGAERHTPHRAGVAGERGAEGLAGVGVPQPHGVVVAAGGERVPVGAERHAVHRAGVAGERGAEGLAGVGVPQPHGFVVAAGGERWPSGLNATLFTASVWPVSGGPRGWPVSAFHSRTVPSSLAEASGGRRG